MYISPSQMNGGKIWLANLKLINMENDKITIFFYKLLIW